MQTRPSNVFSVCPDAPTSRAPARAPVKKRKVAQDEYTIFRNSDLEALRICKVAITKEDVIKAGKCAKFKKDYKAYKYYKGSVEISMSEFPIKHDVYLREVQKASSSKTQIFSTCPEGPTSSAPVRVQQVIMPTSPVKKQLLDVAISSLEKGISALKELSKKL